ncbi:MAG TPA: LCP family protein [Galbitalea sp.]|jgi:LCP family protein required for cell wall assembly
MSQNYNSATSARPMPVRNPNLGSRSVMTKRAWWLVGLNILMPGSAQAVAGSRRLGKFGLFFTLLLWLLAIVAIVLWLTAQTTVIDIATNVIALTIVQVFLAFYAILWVILTLDTLRLTKLVKAGPAARVGVALLAIVVMVGVSGVAARGAFLAGVTRSTIGSVFSSNKQYADPINGRYNILLLGGDAGPDRVGLRPDSISVASVNAETGQTTLIGVPRNMQMAPFVKGSPLYGPYPHGYNCGENCLISYLYTYGQAHPSLYPDAVKDGSQPGIEATRDAVEGVLGIPIPYYAIVDMAGFSDLVNALGGITIDVTQRLPIGGAIDANGQPINVDQWINPGVQKMNGFTAQWYARSRHGTSDYDRMERQRQVQAAILAQFQPSIVLSKFEAIASAGKQIVHTDIPRSMLGRFVDLANKARREKVDQLELVPPAVFEPNPNFVEIQQMVADKLAITPSTSSPRPSP